MSIAINWVHCEIIKITVEKKNEASSQSTG